MLTKVRRYFDNQSKRFGVNHEPETIGTAVFSDFQTAKFHGCPYTEYAALPFSMQRALYYAMLIERYNESRVNDADRAVAESKRSNGR